MESRIKRIIFIYAYLYFTISLNLFSCRPLENKFKSFVDDDEITTITKDSEKELIEAIEVLNEKGGTIYIDTPVITLSQVIIISSDLDLPGGIIGVRQTNGEYPRINFAHSDTDLFSGIYIYGSNIFIEYIIIENSLNHGITVLGDNNIFDHVISRYNFGSGFNVEGNFNSFNYCYSYRNADTSAFLPNSDGFKISGESNNVFNYCFAWDNKNSGFNYKRPDNSSDLSYLHSGSWNNGNVNVFTGKYDYDNGKPLDKNLWTIQDIIKSDEKFVSNYYNKNFNINDDARIGLFTVQEWISFVSPRMDGNGFTFGNINSTQSIDVKRNSFYNVAFDHKSGGFIDNYNHRYNAFITDCVSFNNGINYKFPYYTISKWSNNWSWNSKNKEQLNGGVKFEKPRNINTAQRQFYNVRNQITNAVFANMFPDNVNFDKAINDLIK